MKKILFIDRDGTLIIEPKDNFQVDAFEKLEFYPGVITYLSKIANEQDFLLVMVTNQDGLGTPSFPEEKFWPIQNFIMKTFENEGIHFHEVLIDKSFPHENLPTRKPGTAMLTHYLQGNYDLKNSYVIGDRITDVQLAKNIGCKSIFIGTDLSVEADLITTSWREIYLYLKNNCLRKSYHKRKTNETEIEVSINLDGQGKCEISTGIGFLDHMLEQLAKHGQIDLVVKARGDLNVDEHHTIEDVAITLGEAFNLALGDKKGIERYGFVLPMDDCEAHVSVDFSGRPWLVWNAEFKREKIGDFPTEMFMHFYKSFSDSAKCNLHIKADGTNEHHKIEAIFKAFARAVKMAIQKSGSDTIPSTKGTL